MGHRGTNLSKIPLPYTTLLLRTLTSSPHAYRKIPQFSQIFFQGLLHTVTDYFFKLLTTKRQEPSTVPRQCPPCLRTVIHSCEHSPITHWVPGTVLAALDSWEYVGESQVGRGQSYSFSCGVYTLLRENKQWSTIDKQITWLKLSDMNFFKRTAGSGGSGKQEGCGVLWSFE